MKAAGLPFPARANLVCGWSRYANSLEFAFLLCDNVPVRVGPVAAAPDGLGFKAVFSDFKVVHLPDIRRQEWLEKNR